MPGSRSASTAPVKLRADLFFHELLTLCSLQVFVFGRRAGFLDRRPHLIFHVRFHLLRQVGLGHAFGLQFFRIFGPSLFQEGIFLLLPLAGPFSGRGRICFPWTYSWPSIPPKLSCKCAASPAPKGTFAAVPVKLISGRSRVETGRGSQYGPPPSAMGRRQAVRHRILIPAYGGSNPPAPASLRPVRRIGWAGVAGAGRGRYKARPPDFGE